MNFKRAQAIVNKYMLMLFYANGKQPIRSADHLQAMIFLLRKNKPELDQALTLLDSRYAVGDRPKQK